MTPASSRLLHACLSSILCVQGSSWVSPIPLHQTVVSTCRKRGVFKIILVFPKLSYYYVFLYSGFKYSFTFASCGAAVNRVWGGRPTSDTREKNERGLIPFPELAHQRQLHLFTLLYRTLYKNKPFLLDFPPPSLHGSNGSRQFSPARHFRCNLEAISRRDYQRIAA